MNLTKRQLEALDRMESCEEELVYERGECLRRDSSSVASWAVYGPQSAWRDFRMLRPTCTKIRARN